jgi:3-oxoadipate enol-lactonase
VVTYGARGELGRVTAVSRELLTGRRIYLPEPVMPDVDAGGCRISYTIDGVEGAPVLLLSNALGTTRELWRPQLPTLASRFLVVGYDTRGHGLSEVSSDGYTLDRMGADAVAVLDDLGVARAHVAGISLGGLTAMWLARYAPDRVDRVVLANTAARIGSREIWEQRIADVRSGGLRKVADAAPGRWFTPEFRARRPDAVLEAQSMLCGIDPDGYVGCAGVLRDADLSGEIARITAPTLVLSGRHDPVTTMADADHVCTQVHGARQHMLEAAHLANVEAAEAFTAAMLNFLAERSVSQAGSR